MSSSSLHTFRRSSSRTFWTLGTKVSRGRWRLPCSHPPRAASAAARLGAVPPPLFFSRRTRALCAVGRDPHLPSSRRVDPTVKRNLPCVQYYDTVCLFADVSGFTKLSEAMAMMYGVGGAEYLAKHLNSYFQMMSRIIAADGGDIFKYAGDAVIVLWPDHDDLVTRARRAVQSGVSIQKALHKAELVVAKPEEGVQGVELSVKCGVGVGPVSVLHMGALLDRLEYVAVGDPLVQAFDAEHHAVSGDLICSKATWALVQQYFTAEKIDEHDGVAWVDTDAAYDQTRKVNKQHMLQGMLNTLESDPEVEDKVCMYLPGAVKGTLSGDSKQEGWGNELRSVVVVFVNLGLKNHDLLAAATYHEARCRAHDVLFAVQKAVYAYEGSVNKFLMDDKGSTLIAVWGLPPLAHENDSLRAVLASLNLCAALEKLGLSASCGITTGTAFCGVVGSTTRKEYSVLGDCVNLSARLMQASCGYGGGIICDKATTDLVGPMLKFQHLDPIFVKGKSVPISIAKPYVIPEAELDDSSPTKMRLLYAKQLAFFDEANAVRPVANEDLGRTPTARSIVDMLSHAGEKGDTQVRRRSARAALRARRVRPTSARLRARSIRAHALLLTPPPLLATLAPAARLSWSPASWASASRRFSRTACTRSAPRSATRPLCASPRIPSAATSHATSGLASSSPTSATCSASPRSTIRRCARCSRGRRTS